MCIRTTGYLYDISSDSVNDIKLMLYIIVDGIIKLYLKKDGFNNNSNNLISFLSKNANLSERCGKTINH